MYTIAHIVNAFTEKFGIPRQSGLAEEIISTIVFEEPFRNPDALRGLEGFSHIWLIWGFSKVSERRERSESSGAEAGCNGKEPDSVGSTQNSASESGSGGSTPDFAADYVLPANAVSWSPTVRPPRLGGNTRLGVFATRSPFRPNPIGLSCVRLLRIEKTADCGIVLKVAGADLMNGTPIYDIKPYIPYADSKPEASGGWTEDSEFPHLEVELPEEFAARLGSELALGLIGALAEDPRPAYKRGDNREYTFSYDRFQVSFRVEGGTVHVTGVN